VCGLAISGGLELADVAARDGSQARRPRRLCRPQARYSPAHPWPMHPRETHRRRAQVRERMRTMRSELVIAARSTGANGGARRGNARWGVAVRREAAPSAQAPAAPPSIVEVPTAHGCSGCGCGGLAAVALGGVRHGEQRAQTSFSPRRTPDGQAPFRLALGEYGVQLQRSSSPRRTADGRPPYRSALGEQGLRSPIFLLRPATPQRTSRAAASDLSLSERPPSMTASPTPKCSPPPLVAALLPAHDGGWRDGGGHFEQRR
jgi:hypothetical protein